MGGVGLPPPGPSPIKRGKVAGKESMESSIGIDRMEDSIGRHPVTCRYPCYAGSADMLVNGCKKSRGWAPRKYGYGSPGAFPEASGGHRRSKIGFQDSGGPGVCQRLCSLSYLAYPGRVPFFWLDPHFSIVAGLFLVLVNFYLGSLFVIS